MSTQSSTHFENSEKEGGVPSTIDSAPVLSDKGFRFGVASTTGPPPAPAVGGFSFGVNTNEAPAPAVGGFSFGVNTKAPAPAVGGFKFPIEAAVPNTTVTDAKPVSSRPVKSAQHYFDSMSLEDQEYGLDEVEEVCTEAMKAWNTVSQDGKERGRKAESGRLLKELGVVENNEVSAGMEAIDQWDEAGFVEWYIHFMFDEESGEDHTDYVDETNLDTGAAGSGTAIAAESWKDVNWTVNPTVDVKEGDAWKCEKCFTVNKWVEIACKACGVNGTHPPALEAAKLPRGFPAASQASIGAPVSMS